MSGECEVCLKHTLDCTCKGDYRECDQYMHQYWSKVMLDRKFTHLGEKFKPIDEFDEVDPPAQRLERMWINVKGREEHEAMLRDSDKMHGLGLDPAYEKMVYLKRWGSWLNGCTNYLGET